MRKFKVLPIIFVTTLPVVGYLSTSISCSKKINIKQQVLDEFIGNKNLNISGLVSVPRPGYYHDKIIPYLKKRIKSIANLKDSQINVDNHGNICFDIPASKGYENKDMVILQGHTDMVVAGMTEIESRNKPIEVVRSGNTIHSKDYKTSIGADDGAGIAIALTILKNRDNFNHGPIRFLFSADEDVGMIGASQVSEDWFKYKNDYVKWLINVDAENVKDVCRSCAGSVRLAYTNQFVPVADELALEHQFILSIDGLAGGHGADLKNKANADRLVYEFFYELTKNNENIQIISHFHPNKDGHEENFAPNQINNHCQVKFNSNLSSSELNVYWNNCLDKWAGKYIDENWNHVKSLTSLIEKNDPSALDFISKGDSKLLSQIWGNTDIDLKQTDLAGIYYGVFERDGDFPLYSSNIGPIVIGQQKGAATIKFDAWTSCRSARGDRVSQERYSINWMKAQYSRIVDGVLTVQDGPTYYPWEKDINNPLVKILIDGYKNLGINASTLDSAGGCEPAWWFEKSKGNTTCACVGPTITGAHSTKETLYIDTIEPVYQNIVNTITTLSNKK